MKEIENKIEEKIERLEIKVSNIESKRESTKDEIERLRVKSRDMKEDIDNIRKNIRALYSAKRKVEAVRVDEACEGLGSLF